MLYQDRFDPDLKITFNGDEYTCSRREVLRLDYDNQWKPIKFIDIKAGDVVRLKDPDGSFVADENGRDIYTAKSNAKVNELGLLCFEI